MYAQGEEAQNDQYFHSIQAVDTINRINQIRMIIMQIVVNPVILAPVVSFGGGGKSYLHQSSAQRLCRHCQYATALDVEKA